MLKTISFKASEEDYVNWRKEAVDEGYTFGAWVRRRLNSGLTPPPPPPVAPTLAAIATAPKIIKPHKCPHRLPPGTYCKTCERIKK